MTGKYGYFDCQLVSELLLPELGTAPPGENTITLCEGDVATGAGELVHTWQDDDGETVMTCRRIGSLYQLTVPGYVDSLVDTAAARVTFTRLEGADDASLRHLLLDQVIPRLVAGIGRLVIHGAAIATGDSPGTTVFIGPSGSGKSTLAASWMLDGGQVLTDDCVAVRSSAEGGYEVEGAYPGVRLTGESRRLLGVTDSDLTGTANLASYSDKLRLPAGRQGYRGACPLQQFVLLKPASIFSITELPASEAVFSVVSECFALDPGNTGETAARLESVSRMIDSGVSVLEASYPKTLESLQRLKAELALCPGL